jgi:hypothetical protein
MPWGVVASVGGALVSGYMNGKNQSSASAAADPFASQRPQYQGQLQNLMQSSAAQGGSTATIGQMQNLLTPGQSAQSLSQMPGYQFQLSQGTSAIDRSAAAGGFLGSGQEGLQLEQFGQGLASQSFQQYFTDLGTLSNQQSTNFGNQYQQLAQLSGANIGNPGVAGQLQAQSIANTGATASSLINQFGNSSAGQSVGNWFGGLFSGNGGSGAPSLSSGDVAAIYGDSGYGG